METHILSGLHLEQKKEREHMIWDMADRWPWQWPRPEVWLFWTTEPPNATPEGLEGLRILKTAEKQTRMAKNSLSFTECLHRIRHQFNFVWNCYLYFWRQKSHCSLLQTQGQQRALRTKGSRHQSWIWKQCHVHNGWAVKSYAQHVVQRCSQLHTAAEQQGKPKATPLGVEE